MGIKAAVLFWKYLQDVSDTTIYAQVDNIWSAIRAFSEKEKVVDNIADLQRNMSLEEIKRLLYQANDRYAKRTRAFPLLPAFAIPFTLFNERWEIIISMTKIPHLKGMVISSPQSSTNPPAYRVDLSRWLIESQIADVGFIKPERLYGKTWEVYFFCKIRSIGKIRSCFELEEYNEAPLLFSPEKVFPNLSDSLPLYTCISSAPVEIKEFLKKCDKVILSKIHSNELERYLAKLPISTGAFF